MARPLKKGRAFEALEKKSQKNPLNNLATKLEGRRGKAFVDGPLKNKLNFLRLKAIKFIWN